MVRSLLPSRQLSLRFLQLRCDCLSGVLHQKDYICGCNRHQHELHISRRFSYSVLFFLCREVLFCFLQEVLQRNVYKLRFHSFSEGSSVLHAHRKEVRGYLLLLFPSTDRSLLRLRLYSKVLSLYLHLTVQILCGKLPVRQLYRPAYRSVLLHLLHSLS